VGLRGPRLLSIWGLVPPAATTLSRFFVRTLPACNPPARTLILIRSARDTQGSRNAEEAMPGAEGRRNPISRRQKSSNGRKDWRARLR
jgi:hypothetical protein